MKVLLIVLGIIGVITAVLFFFMMYGMAEIKQLIIKDVDLSKVPDGTYTGSYHKGRWVYDVVVTVKNHRIVSVKSTNPRMDVAKEVNEKIEAAILDRQSVHIDVVSGATVNTKAFQKAVENALSAPAGHSP